jgi:hypothetical protein
MGFFPPPFHLDPTPQSPSLLPNLQRRVRFTSTRRDWRSARQSSRGSSSAIAATENKRGGASVWGTGCDATDSSGRVWKKVIYITQRQSLGSCAPSRPSPQRGRGPTRWRTPWPRKSWQLDAGTQRNTARMMFGEIYFLVEKQRSL